MFMCMFSDGIEIFGCARLEMMNEDLLHKKRLKNVFEEFWNAYILCSESGDIKRSMATFCCKYELGDAVEIYFSKISIKTFIWCD